MSRISLPAVSSNSGFTKYLNEIKRFPMLEAEEEYMLAKRWVEHADYSAAQQLITSHLRLVSKIAFTFRGYGLPLMDLVAEGNIGLMQAVKKFDPEKGFRLSTYAMWWIRASIQEYILRSWSLVKVGTSAGQKRLFFNLRKMKKRLQQAERGELTPEQIKTIADELEVSEQDVIDMDQRMSATDQYLSNPVGGEDSKSEVGDFIADTSDNQETVYAEREELDRKKSLLRKALAKLNPREQAIIQERRISEEPKTLEELSQLYNISRERVRQIESRAMEKLTAEMKLLAAS